MSVKQTYLPKGRAAGGSGAGAGAGRGSPQCPGLWQGQKAPTSGFSGQSGGVTGCAHTSPCPPIFYPHVAPPPAFHTYPSGSQPPHLPSHQPLCLALLLWPLDLPFPEACPLPLPSAWNILPSDVHSAGDCLAFECQLRCSPRLQGRVSWSPVQAGRPGPHCRAALASFL